MVLLPMPEATTRTAALLFGQVDFVEAPSPAVIPKMKGGSNEDHSRNPVRPPILHVTRPAAR
jgi:hypothetical protein